jgi:hypothetical protein
MKISNLFYCILIFFCQSCTFIHYMNTKEIVSKNESEINNYLESNKIDYYDYSFLSGISIDSLSNEQHVLDLWKYERKIEQSSIQIRIYNSSGNLINGYTQCYGDFNSINIFAEKNTKKFQRLPNNCDLLFENELSLLNIQDKVKNEIKLKSSQKTFTVVIYWNIWSQHFSKIMFQNLKKYLRKYDMRDNVLVILINTDNVQKN